MPRSLRLLRAIAPLLLVFGAAATARSATPAPHLEPCWLQGVDSPFECGRVPRPEDPDAPAGRSIPIHFAVARAQAQQRHADPVFIFAGGPGQAATATAAQVQGIFARLNARRDIVYVDLRGTGASNPLHCEPDREPDREPGAASADAVDLARVADSLGACIPRLDADVRQYATWIAVRDVDAVREALGYDRINLWGASYGTRAALEYLRQFPRQVRSVVLDGAVPPDLRLPASAAHDADAALASVERRCASDPGCARRHPDLHARIDQLLAGSANTVTAVVPDPLTGRQSTWRLDRASLASALRAPLYTPETAALVPHAIAAAARYDYGPLAALNSTVRDAAGSGFAQALHFAVVCAEDVPRVTPADREAARATRFGTTFIDLYDAACRAVPIRQVPAAFFTLAKVDVPVLVLSGGTDPITPPRAGDAVSRGLLMARHLVAPNLGHGISARGCAPDLITRFVTQANFEGVDGGCLQRLPSPPFFAIGGEPAR